MSDYLTKAQAEEQAQRIRDYWAARGHRIETFVIAAETREPNASKAYVVRSNVKNGLPRAS